MGIRRGSISTPIIADGLVYNLDAANRASTIPSTNTLKTFNTINPTQSGSLRAEASWNNETAPAFDFDGVDDYIITDFILPAISKYSISCWFKTTTSGVGAGGETVWVIINDAGSNTTGRGGFQIKSNQWTSGMGDDTGNYWYLFSSGNLTSSPPDCLDTNWHNSTITINGYIQKLYIDGAFIYSVDTSTGGGAGSNGVSAGVAATVPLTLGCYGAGGGWFLNGEISNLSIYNRLLSSTEVLHNYNALKGRFGL